jgi:HPt (histidine-containing phosphotransfer) domain-containing protein
MTAHALKGDRERCLAAGMDGYLAKPIRQDDLYRTIEEAMSAARDRAVPSDHVLLGTGPREAGPKTPRSGGSGKVLDRIGVLKRVGGNTKLLLEIARLFLEDCPRLLGDIRTAMAHADPARLTRAAHTLKGAVANFCAPTALEAAQHLEVLGQTGNLDEVDRAYAVLEGEIRKLNRSLTEFLPELVRP